jgi:spermidine synthase
MKNPFKNKKTNQRLLHKVKNGIGVIEVMENQFVRTLYFNSGSRQSCMYLDNPKALALEYTQSMALSFLLNENINTALILGLGGGSLVKFIHHYFPLCQIDAVEKSQEVKNIAYNYFALPKHQNIQVYIDDAGNFIRSSKAREYDLIAVDAYDANKMSNSVQDIGFFNACFTHLKPGGVFCINLWIQHTRALNSVLRALNSCFSNQILHLPVEERKANLILFGIKGSFSITQKNPLNRHAKKLQEQTGVDFLPLLRKLRKHNPHNI